MDHLIPILLSFIDDVMHTSRKCLKERAIKCLTISIFHAEEEAEDSFQLL